MCAIMPPEFMQYNTVGLPMPSVEIKLLDVPEAGYLSTNNPPQGEVCIRGPSVIKGYFKRDDLNNDESIFTKDGWFRTGDVAQWNPDGTLRIIDRSVHVFAFPPIWLSGVGRAAVLTRPWASSHTASRTLSSCARAR